MFRPRFLPWEYGVRNLLRRPARTVLTLCAVSTVVLLVFVVVGFIRGLEKSLAVSGDPAVVLVYSITAEENIENSSIAGRSPDLLAASVEGVQRRFGVTHVSPELYLGTRVQAATSDKNGLGLVRGVTPSAPLVRRRVQLTEGRWPGPGEIMVGKLVAAKLGCQPEELAIGQLLKFEKKSWKISGRFSSGGSSFESEIWCRLPDFQEALKRQDLSLVAMLMEPGVGSTAVEIFCKERTDLELQALSETAYYASLQKHYKPMRLLAWMVVLLVAGAGIFAGLNMMYGAVSGRIRELATLQAIGYRRRAIMVSLIQEGALLAAAGSLLSALLALFLINGAAVRFTMGAFELRIDSVALLVGCGVGLLLGVAGAIPPAIKALRLPVAQSLKAI
ncbi:ABC transporter permease [Planctomicrobium piriforme]|uniref:Putative ABC transport system permease protein n=1 Tax=Planctomicrobium piriforme TaxID=1576369 RepID=A0A1I3R9L1_9PLAN|nr:ABC transporter permease [Planctomicrobium piriforme]SFJ43293.1 putative ABC transport system permease protein [Planctomicrobium piriforme]